MSQNDKIMSGLKMVGKCLLAYVYVVAVLIVCQLFFYFGGFSILSGVTAFIIGMIAPFMIGYLKQSKKGGSCADKACSCNR